MKSMFRIRLVLIALIIRSAVAGAAPSEKDIRTAWQFKNLAPELSAFLNHADAVLTLRVRPRQSVANDPKPNVFIYRIRVSRKIRLSQKQEWTALLDSQIKQGQRTELAADSSIPGRYFTESTIKKSGDGPPVHSLYLLVRAKNDEVILLVYDDVGTGSTHNRSLVQQLYSGLNADILNRLHRD